MTEMVKTKRRCITRQCIHLASNEWGSGLMDEIAGAHFEQYEGDKEALILEVYEHGGWYLTYGWIAGRIRIVGSANDAARFDPEIKEFWERNNSSVCDGLYVASIRRGEQ